MTWYFVEVILDIAISAFSVKTGDILDFTVTWCCPRSKSAPGSSDHVMRHQKEGLSLFIFQCQNICKEEARAEEKTTDKPPLWTGSVNPSPPAQGPGQADGNVELDKLIMGDDILCLHVSSSIWDYQYQDQIQDQNSYLRITWKWSYK